MISTIAELIANQAHFKNETIRQRFSLMHPKTQEIALDAFNYALTICVDHPVFTETVTTLEEDQKCNREADQHRRRVAFDFRVIDWSGEQIDEMAAYLNAKYKAIAYISKKTGTKVIAYYHDNGNGPHFHVAINSTYKLPEFKLAA